MHQTLQIITLALISLCRSYLSPPLAWCVLLFLQEKRDSEKKKKKKPHKQISHLT